MGEPMNRNRLFIGTPTTFEKAHPELEDAVIEWTHSDFGIKPSGKMKSSLKEIGGFIQCSNPLCQRGGFDIDIEILNPMLDEKETMKKGILTCPGDEGSPKGRKIGRSS